MSLALISFWHDFNPRPPSGERLELSETDDTFIVFQSTPPERGATR